MDPQDAELWRKLLTAFREETDEHLLRLETLLSALQETPSSEPIEEAFRRVHSLKGAARSVGLQEMEGLCQNMESVFAAVKKGEIPLGRELIDLLFLAADLAADLAREAGEEIRTELREHAAHTEQRLREAARGQIPPQPPSADSTEQPQPQDAPPPPSAEQESAPSVLRVETARMERLLVQAEELTTDRISAERLAEGLRDAVGALGGLRRNIAEAAAHLQQLQREIPSRALLLLAGRLSDGEEKVVPLEEEMRALMREADENQRSLETKTQVLLDDLHEMLMLPVGTLLEQLPRTVRDLARDAGKEVDLVAAGKEIRMDRRLLAELRDPILHLVRNAVDHGIEPPQERKILGKPERGRIRLEVSVPRPRRVLWKISDDGRGLDVEKIRETAVREGLLPLQEAEALEDEGAAALAFSSGISTRREVTALSGRGLGLPIVREKIEKLGGSVRMQSRPGEGILFDLDIPAALAAFRGVLVQLGVRRYIFPAVGVDRIVRVEPERIAVVENRDVVELDGRPLAVVRLEIPLELPLAMPQTAEMLPLIIVESRGRRVAFVVDEVLAEQEFQVKTLGPQLLQVPNLSGATLLPDGDIALILDPDQLINNASRSAAPPSPKEREVAEVRRAHLLVVEDSLTARTLLRHILEGAGYHVTTAVDGLDALTKLKSSPVDVVVSDVEMPRMGGFDLTRRIREEYGRLPVILVTGLGSAEDRERGIEVGADAYIVKSRFDQGNLLETIGRLT